jgi:hypothetical protein
LPRAETATLQYCLEGVSMGRQIAMWQLRKGAEKGDFLCGVRRGL